MNVYGIIILLTLLAGFLLDIISDYLNIKNLDKGLPEEFSDIYDEDKYNRSQQYTKVRTKFGFISSVFSLAILLVFWFSGGFNYLDIFVSERIDGFIWRGLAFTGILIIANSILSLPFSLYSTFVIEERFGFNKTTPKTFVLDILKSLGLGVALGGPLLALILYILMETGPYAWLYGWVAVTVISLIVQYLAPTLIMPLFNKFTPLEDGELKEAIFSMAASVGFPLKKLFVMDGSKRSSKSNAFFTGFGKNKRIALFDTLIEKHTPKELVAVLAHEIGHYMKKHILQGMVISILHFGLLFYLLSVFLTNQGLYEAFFMDGMPIYAGLLFFSLLYSPVESILSIVMNMLSRKNEYEADSYAAEVTKTPSDLITALKKMSGDNLSNLTPHPFYVFINYSHPPVLERIRYLKKMER